MNHSETIGEMSADNDNYVDTLPRPEVAETSLAEATQEALDTLRELFGGVIPNGRQLQDLFDGFSR